MQTFYVFILRYDVVIYFICAFGLFWYISQFVRGQQILRRAMFNLEWETGSRIRNTAFVFIVIFTGVATFSYYVNQQIAPTLPPDLLKPPTPTIDIFATRLSSPTPLSTVPPSATAPLVATITLPGQNLPPGVSPLPGTAAVQETLATPTPFVGCNVTLNISDPREGSVVNGLITLFGTVNTENFAYYTLEANGPQTSGQWASLLGREVDQVVENAQLGAINLSEWSSGPYLIRLTAVDRNNNLTGHCVIQITLDNN